MSAGRGWGVASGAVALVLAACGGSGFEYVTNSDKGLYFKIPEEWSTFAVEVDDRPDAAAPERPWVIVVDSAPQPAADHIEATVPEHPVGLAEIAPLLRRRDEVSLSFLRSLALGGEADPVRLVQEGNSSIEIVRYDEIALDSGLRGGRIALNLELQSGEFLTIDQTALVNNDTSLLYRLLIKCEAQCYVEHQDEIDDIVESWTIEER